MNKLISFVAIACCYIDFYGQITIPATHMPTIGDVFTYATHNQIYTPKPLTGGVYDFSDLVQDDTSVFKYVANDKTVEFPNSNLKFTEDDNDQATIFFKKDGNDLFVISLAQIQSQIPIPGIGGLKGTMKYSSFPITASTNISSNDEIAMTIPKAMLQGIINVDSLAATILPGATVDSLRLSIKFTLNLFSDGSGKIKTPIDNNIDVLKVVRKISIVPKLGLYGKAFGFPINNFDVTDLLAGQLPIDDLDITTHTYYSPSFRQEIIVATLDSIGQYQRVSFRYRTKNGVIINQIQSARTNKLDFEFVDGKIEVINMSPNQTAEISIFSMDGRKLQEKKVTMNDTSLYLNNSKGVRIVTIVDESGILTKKIFIQ